MNHPVYKYKYIYILHAIRDYTIIYVIGYTNYCDFYTCSQRCSPQ